MSFKQILSLLSVVLFLNIYISSSDNDNVVKGGDKDSVQIIEVTVNSGTGEND